MDLARCSLNSITVRSLDLPNLISEAVQRGVGAIAPWRDLIEPHGAEKAGRMIGEAGLGVSSLCRGGMFTGDSAKARLAAVEDNRRAIAEAHAVGARTLVLVCGPIVGNDIAGSRAMVRDGIEAVLEDAQQAGISLGIEPLHPMMAADRSVITSLREANELRAAIDHDSVGVVIDAYHVWWEHDLEHQIAAASGRILGFHVSDWVLPINGQCSSRGMPGDGCIDLPGMRRMVEAARYGGFVEVEVLSDRWWAEEPDLVLTQACDRFQSAV
ncbi:sugar phosphate isomerase/epimerase family protein [Saccharopolyspora sp. NPDC049426]|uniref:sugar phosphate isomerase/epimerase family protein n=1 Tax=Saccharopolyspora sp. NPDC049426 TaxID=3155652 RepID=UPI00341F3E05